MLKVYGSLDAIWRELDARAQGVLGEKVYQALVERRDIRVVDQITDAVESIRQTGCKVLGAVLNEVCFKNLSNRHYYYNSKRYSSYYTKRYGQKKRKDDREQ